MEQKDYILREIEKISTLLNYLLSKLRLSNANTEEEDFVFLNKELVEGSGLDIGSILKLSKEDFDQVLNQNKGFNFENIELLADVLFTIGAGCPENKKDHLVKALDLYEYIDIKSKTFSFERQEKVFKARALL